MRHLIPQKRRRIVELPIQAVGTQRLYQQIADQLSELIRCGEFPAGHRLPPERDLARQLGVSRPVVREAMIALEIAGLIEIRTGSGIYARKAVADAVQPSVLTDQGPSPFDVLAARRMLEPEIAFAAAESRSEADLDSIAETLEKMRKAKEGRVLSADRLFHTRIAAATGNSVLVSMVDQLWELMLTPIFRSLDAHAGPLKNRRVALAEHARILDALRRRDGVAARDAMRAHVTRTETILMATDVQ